MRYFILFLLLIRCDPVCAKPFSFNIGISAFYVNINDPKYHYTKEFEQPNPSLTLGLSKSLHNFTFTLQTNRLTNYPLTRSVLNRKGVTLQNKSKLITDTITLGYRLGRVIPSFILTNARVDKQLRYKGNFLGKDSKSTILYGVSFGYLITRSVIGSVIYIAPNHEFDLESAMGLGVNYLF